MGSQVLERFDYITPTPESIALHERVRRQFLELALLLDSEVADSRAKSLALTELEAALMWANRAIAMEFGVPTQGSTG